MFRSASLKLTAWYLGLAVAISLVFSVVVYNVGTNEIARSIHLQTARIYDQFPVFDDNPILRSGASISSSDHRFLLRLIFLNIIILGLAGFASYWLAKRTLEPIEEAHEQQKRFTADVSHELRTPLTALKMESEVALLNPKASLNDLKTTLNSNLEEVNKLERLVNNILKLTKLEADELKQNFIPINTLDFTSAAIKQVQAQADKRQVGLTSDITDHKIYGDQDSLTQLLVILLDNAIKYSDSGSKVSLSSSVNDHKYVIKVKDSGKGISKENLEHIFDRFYRAENSRNKSFDQEGYGLGLSIAKMIADVHDAVIIVNSSLGKGTEVSVNFPLE